ncbi:uncharacterized protein [Coffea arabica]|uniref:Uncharacterized protein isoform X2 n=1 Tax=Coffea arabica TaxID=13443 RepID=A0A6P6T338_COFAR|nr:uncharacterized protein LOC113697221 isoform X2 [Coffea arabica]
MDIVTARDTKVVAMGRKSSGILIAFVVIMLMAIAAYIKIWTIDYRISSQESLLLRSLYCNSLILPTEKPWMNLQSGGRGLIWRSRRVKCASRNSIKSRNLARLRVRLVSTRNWSCWRRKIWTCLNK